MWPPSCPHSTWRLHPRVPLWGRSHGGRAGARAWAWLIPAEGAWPRADGSDVRVEPPAGSGERSGRSQDGGAGAGPALRGREGPPRSAGWDGEQGGPLRSPRRRSLRGASPGEKRGLLGAFRGLTGASPRPFGARRRRSGPARGSAGPFGACPGPPCGLSGAFWGRTGLFPRRPGLNRGFKGP